jgi:hypothetical protein
MNTTQIFHSNNNNDPAQIGTAISMVAPLLLPGYQISITPAPVQILNYSRYAVRFQSGHAALHGTTQGRDYHYFMKYQSWTMDKKYFDLNNPLQIESLLPAVDVHWISKAKNGIKWQELKGVLVVDVRKVYRLVQDGTLVCKDRSKYGEIELSHLHKHNCILAEAWV